MFQFVHPVEACTVERDRLFETRSKRKTQSNKTHARLRTARIRHDGAKTLMSRPVTKPAKLHLILRRLLLKMVQDRLDQRERRE